MRWLRCRSAHKPIRSRVQRFARQGPAQDAVGFGRRTVAAQQHGDQRRRQSWQNRQLIGLAGSCDQQVEFFLGGMACGIGDAGCDRHPVAERLQQIDDGGRDIGGGGKHQTGKTLRRDGRRIVALNRRGGGKGRLSRNGQGEPELCAFAGLGIKADPRRRPVRRCVWRRPGPGRRPVPCGHKRYRRARRV